MLRLLQYPSNTNRHDSNALRCITGNVNISDLGLLIRTPNGLYISVQSGTLGLLEDILFRSCTTVEWLQALLHKHESGKPRRHYNAGYRLLFRTDRHVPYSVLRALPPKHESARLKSTPTYHHGCLFRDCSGINMNTKWSLRSRSEWYGMD